MSNVIILKWVFSWEWRVIRMALELVPTLEDLSGSDPLTWLKREEKLILK